MAYDGSAYHGWQIQPKDPTVQEALQKALSTLLRQDMEVVGCGRTDTGVHASCFVAHFDLPFMASGASLASAPDSEQFLFKLNRFLAQDLVVYRIWKVDPGLHARFSATSRTYHYHIHSTKAPFRRNFSHHLFGKLDVAEIDQCCQIIRQSTDFTSFSKLHTDVKNNDCVVSKVQWLDTADGYRFEITANRFLRDMVRSLTGTLLEVGQGKIKRADFQRIVDAKDRQRAGQSVPAKGLFLADVTYPGQAGFQP